MDASRKANAGRKALVLALFIVAAVLLVRFTPLKDALTVETSGALIESAGMWAPVACILAYAAGVCLFAPGTLLAIIGATVFGPYLGFVYVWIGAMPGSSLAFLTGRNWGELFGWRVLLSVGLFVFSFFIPAVLKRLKGDNP